MVRMMRHNYVVVRSDPPAQSPISACTCGWRGTVIAAQGVDPDPGFDEWLNSHFDPFLQAGGLRGMVAYDSISRLAESFAKEQHVHWISSDRQVIALSWGWWSTINRTAQGILMLSSIGQSREAVPLVRVVFEHSLYLQALIRHGESAVDAAVREHMRQSRNLIETAKGGLSSAGLKLDVNQLEVPDPTPDALWTQQVITICDRLGLKNTLYFIYRILCSYTHPTISAAQQFLKAPEEIDLGLAKEPDFNIDSDMLFWTAVMMVWAGQAFNTILVQPIQPRELELAARELGVVPIEELPTSSNFGAMDVSPERIEQLMFGDHADHQS